MFRATVEMPLALMKQACLKCLADYYTSCSRGRTATKYSVQRKTFLSSDLKDVDQYLPGGLLTDSQEGVDPFGTGSYGYDQSQVRKNFSA